LTTGSVA